MRTLLKTWIVDIAATNLHAVALSRCNKTHVVSFVGLLQCCCLTTVTVMLSTSSLQWQSCPFKKNPPEEFFSSKKTDAMTFPADLDIFAFFGRGGSKCFHCMDYCLVSGVNYYCDEPMSPPWLWFFLTNSAGLDSYRQTLSRSIHFWSGVKSFLIHFANTFCIARPCVRM